MLLAFAWVNSPAVEIYDLIHHTPLSLQVGAVGLSKPLVDWINEGLMVFFFFAIGLEIKREVLVGDLASPRKIALPGIGALGGMLVPAAVYLLFNAGNPETEHGWAVPVATDIVLALAVLSVLGTRIPPTLKVFLMALAVFDEARALDSQRSRGQDFIDRGEDEKGYSTERIMHEELRHVASGIRWLDYLAEREAELIDEGLSFLIPVWRNADWELFEFNPTVPSPSEATMSAVGADKFQFSAPEAGSYIVRLRYTPYFQVVGGTGCVERAGDWTRVKLAEPPGPTSPPLRVEAKLSLGGFLHKDRSCSEGI